jgi:hypothetical protein
VECTGVCLLFRKNISILVTWCLWTTVLLLFLLRVTYRMQWRTTITQCNMKVQYISYIVTEVRKIYMYLLWYKVLMYFLLVWYWLPTELITWKLIRWELWTFWMFWKGKKWWGFFLDPQDVMRGNTSKI